jgi:hypothetical protein
VNFRVLINTDPGPAGVVVLRYYSNPERAADVVTVVAEPEGPVDEVRVGMNSIDAEEEGEYHWLTDEQIRSGATIELASATGSGRLETASAPARSQESGVGTVVVRWIRHECHPWRNVNRTLRSGLSAFVSTSTRLCQVPSAGLPANTGTVSDGDTKAGRRWSRPCPVLPCR